MNKGKAVASKANRDWYVKRLRNMDRSLERAAASDDELIAQFFELTNNLGKLYVSVGLDADSEYVDRLMLVLSNRLRYGKAK